MVLKRIFSKKANRHKALHRFERFESQKALTFSNRFAKIESSNAGVAQW